MQSLARTGRLVALATSLVALAGASAFVACEDPQDGLPPRTSVPTDETDAASEAASEIDGSLQDATADAGPDGDAGAGDADAGDADAGPTGARFVATGAGPHPTIGFGDHSCAIAGADRSVYCWGANDHGQVGNGKVADAGSGGLAEAGLDDGGGLADDAPTPVKLATDEMGLPFSGADSLSLAAWHSCAKRGDAMYCWGQRYSGAQAEPPFALNPPRSKPRAIGNLDVVAVAAGGAHSCALKADGKITCFGHSYFNELGRAKADDMPCDAPIFYAYPGLTPPHVCSGETLDLATAVTNPKAVTAGELHSCALTAMADVWCWGTNQDAQLGNAIAGNAELNPQRVLTNTTNGSPLANVTALAAGGGRHTCALANDKVACWGSNANGELGVDPATTLSRPTALSVTGILDVIAIGAGDGISCAVKADRTALCWGRDDVGQLGDGAPKPMSFAPVAVKGPGGSGLLTNVIAIAPGRRHVCALRGDATVWCWGNNDRGQLGDGTKNDSLYPVKVVGLPQ